MRRIISTDQAPAAIGTYSQAVQAGDTLYISGQIPLDPATGKLEAGEIEDQTRRVIRNLEAVLATADATLAHVVKTTVYLTDLSLFPRVNAVYAEAFGHEPSPARATVEVSALPLGADVEIDAIARVA